MNKTLKTVLITLAVTLVFLIAIVMIFGEDRSAPVVPSSQASGNIPADAPLNTDKNSSIASSETSTNNITEDLSKEMYAATIAYDIFDWNKADEQGKIEIAENIMRVWYANGSTYSMTSKDLVTYINQNLSNQANIFEIACIYAQIDPQPYLNRTN